MARMKSTSSSSVQLVESFLQLIDDVCTCTHYSTSIVDKVKSTVQVIENSAEDINIFLSTL